MNRHDLFRALRISLILLLLVFAYGWRRGTHWDDITSGVWATIIVFVFLLPAALFMFRRDFDKKQTRQKLRGVGKIATLAGILLMILPPIIFPGQAILFVLIGLTIFIFSAGIWLLSGFSGPAPKEKK